MRRVVLGKVVFLLFPDIFHTAFLPPIPSAESIRVGAWKLGTHIGGEVATEPLAPHPHALGW